MKHTVIQFSIVATLILGVVWLARWSPGALQCHSKGGTNYPPCEKIIKERIR